jgi:hypothetical protein
VIQAYTCTRALRRRAVVRIFLASLALAGMSAVHASTLTIWGTPPRTLHLGDAFSFRPGVSDSLTRRTLTFWIDNRPSWALLNSRNGELYGVPKSTGTYSNIIIKVSDGVRTAALPAFAVTVVASSGKPTSDLVSISGTPATSVATGRPYSFRPTASDSAGRALAFSVQNKPAWASFSIVNGLLSGTPTQTGTYGGIVISAGDGTATGALPPFNISVTGAAPSSGQATLTWVDPTQNTNGSALTNLAGVRIYYGPSASSMTELTQVSGTTTSYTVNNLGSGTWYFGAVAYTTAGAESNMSGIVSKTVP